jgi:hypothetical protein
LFEQIIIAAKKAKFSHLFFSQFYQHECIAVHPNLGQDNSFNTYTAALLLLPTQTNTHTIKQLNPFASFEFVCRTRHKSKVAGQRSTIRNAMTN